MYVIANINNVMGIVVCSDLSGKEPHRQIGVGRAVISESVGGQMVITLTKNSQIGGFDSHSRHNVSHFQHPHDTCII